MVGVDPVWHQRIVVLEITEFPVRFEAIDFVLSPRLSSAPSQRYVCFLTTPQWVATY
jgi:hypothetical protein